MGKKYIPVLLHIDENGRKTPKYIKAGIDGEWLKVKKTTDFCRMASLIAGAVGIRYKCFVDVYGERKMIYLFDENDKWFVETEEDYEQYI